MSLYSSVLADLRRLRAAVMASASLVKYDPNQPRVPAGNPDGGQWTSAGSGSDLDEDLARHFVWLRVEGDCFARP